MLRYDIRKGLLSDYKKIGIVLPICAAFCIQFILLFASRFPDLTYTSFGDVMFWGFSGMPRYQFSPDKPFIFPALWMLLFLLPLFFVLYYPFYDLLGFGKNVLIQVRRRSTWWLSKSAWIVIYVTVYFALIYAATALFCLVMRIPLSTRISQKVYEIVAGMTVGQANADSGNVFLPFSGQMDIQLFVLPILSTIAIALFQMTVSLISTPIYSFILSAGILFSSAYYMSPLLLGNYCMAMRSNLITHDGMDVGNGVLLAVTVSIISIILGLIIFERNDIISKTLREE